MCSLFSWKVKVPSLMWNGDHDLYGIIMGIGSDFPRGYEVKNANIEDVAPTILKIMKLPIPKYLDGKALLK